jgi:hypothetical protein
MDQAGGLFYFKTEPNAIYNEYWQRRGQALATGFDENPAVLPFLHPGPTPATALQVACPGPGKKLVVRQIELGPEGPPVVKEASGALEANLAGTPARVGDKLVLPLTSGFLVSVPLPWNGKTWHAGPNWRTPGPEARGHVTALGDERFVTTDGGRGLTTWEWPQPEAYRSLPEGNESDTLEMPSRIIAAPLLVPPGTDGKTRFVVADFGGALTLVSVDDRGRQTPGQSWGLKGRITGGPFLYGAGAAARIGCVVDHVRLVWIDPSKKTPAWEYRSAGKAFHGLPQAVDDALVLVDQAGHYVALDPKTGKRLGPGYRLQGSMAPAAVPVAFDARRLFAPLSDGTIMLLPAHYLKGAKPAGERAAKRGRLTRVAPG